MKRLLILALGIFLLSSMARAAQITWTGGGDGKSWSDLNNWNPKQVPTLNDDVTIGSSFTVTVSGNPAGANTVACTGTLIINGTLRIAATSSFTTLTLVSGALIPDGTATITGPLTLAGGSIGAGAGNVNISGATTVSAPGGGLGSSGTVTNNGTITIMGNGTQLTTGGLFVNAAAGTINIQGDGNAGINSCCGAIINNNGTISKTMGSGVSILDATTFNNAGTVSVATGTLQMVGGSGFGAGTETGAFNASSGTVLDFALGDYALSTGTTFGGTGTVQIAGGVWDLTADVTVNTTTLQFDGGAGGLTLGAHNLTVNSTTVTWNSGGLGSSGSIGQVTIPNATTVVNIVNSGQQHSLGRNLDFFGTVNMSADLFLGANITIEQGATFNVKTDNSITGSGNISNGGTLEKTGGVGTSNLTLNGFYDTLTNVNTHGTVTLTSGTLNFAFSGSSSLVGIWTNNGTLLEFTVGTYNLGVTGGVNSFVINGAAITALAGATWTAVGDSAVDTPTFSFGSGAIKGAANLTVTSTVGFDWAGGTMSGTGTTTIPHGITVTVSGSPSVYGRTIDNSGNVNISTSTTNLILSGSLWINQKGSTLNFQSDGSLVNGFGATSTFDNLGTVQKSGGSGTSEISFNGTFINDAGGTVLVDTGILALDTPSANGLGGKVVAQNTGSSVTFGSIDHGVYSQWVIFRKTTMSGKGTIAILNGSWTLLAPVTVSSSLLILDGGIIGNSNFTVTSQTTTCSGGGFNVSSPGIVTLSKGNHFISSGGGCSFNGSEIDVFGGLDATQGGYSLGVTDLKIEPGADVKLGDGFSFGAGFNQTKVINQGTIEKPRGAGTFTFAFSGSLENQSTFSISGGTVQAIAIPIIQDSGGNLILGNGATFTDSSTFTENGGTVEGTGDFFVPFTDPGGIVEGGTDTTPGMLFWDAPVALGNGSTMTAAIGGITAGFAPGGTYSQINSTSSVALGGSLNLKFTNGFSPTSSQSFNILNFASSTGSFSSVVTPNPNCTAKLTTTPTSLSVSFTSSNVSVSISPAAVTLKVNTKQQFTDTVTNGCGNGVTWKVLEGNSGGKITPKGLYTAPGTPGTFHVVVTSVADTTKSATATVTVTTAADASKLAITPQAAVLQPGNKLHLQANTAVNWTVVEGPAGGAITANGAFTAPSTPGLYHVMATSSGSSAERAVVNIAVVSGKLQSAYVASLDRNSVSVLTGTASSGSATGQLQQTESLPAGQTPAALAISPDGKYLLSANRDSNDVSLFAITPGDGSLAAIQVPAMDTGTHPSAIAFDPSGRIAFVANHDSDDLSLFAMNGASGPMVSLGKQALAAGDHPSAIAVHSGGSLLFVANAGSDTVAAFRYDAAGMLKPLSGSPFPAGHMPSAAVMDRAGKFLFVANRGSGDVSVFAIDAKNEHMEEVSGSPFVASKGAGALAVDITGSYLFVAGHDTNEVRVFQIASGSGALTLLGHTRLEAAGPSALAVDPSGQSLYVTSDKTGGVTTLNLDVSTGDLTPGASTHSPGRASAIAVGSSTTAATQVP